MRVKCIKKFSDLVAGVDRNPGDVWEVDEERFKSINSTVYGQLVEGESAPKGKRPTKAELIAMAEEKGVEIPEGATNPQIAKLIEEAE